MKPCRSAPRTCFLLLLVMLPSTASATITYTVNSPGDAHDSSLADNACQSSPGVCTLRAAVEQANYLGTFTVIELPAYQITLTLGALSPATDISFEGAGRDVSIVSANLLSRILYINSGGTVSVQDMTLRDGHTASGGGGAIYFNSGSLVSTLFVTRCLFVNNDAPYGGAIYLDDADAVLDMKASEIRDCHATTATAGALSAYKATLRDSTFRANGSATYAGAILVLGQTVNMTNCTVSGNTSGAGAGGGIYVGPSGKLNLYNSTITRNTSYAASGGGVGNDGAAANLTFVNTIISNNDRVSKTTFFPNDCAGAITSFGTSIVSNLGTLCTVSGSYLTGGASLGPLQNNGGPVPTHALLAGSQAIDGGAAGGCTTVGAALLTKDERGVPRPIGARCDIGAYERSPCGDVDGSGVVGVADILFLVNYLFAGGPTPLGLANVSGDGATNVADVLALINNLFASGPALNCPGT